MSMNVLRRARFRSRLHDTDALLALSVLAHGADEDGLYMPVRWDGTDARGQLKTLFDDMERTGEIVRLPAGRAMFWITIAFSPRELQEIAIRRFRMSPAMAALFVLAILERQHSQKRRKHV